MKPVASPNVSDLQFRVRSPLAVVRDLLIIALCAALIGGFLAQVWTRPSEQPARAQVGAPVHPTRG